MPLFVVIVGAVLVVGIVVGIVVARPMGRWIDRDESNEDDGDRPS
ncbi:MAG: hypothetical protein ACJ77N_00345 [Chloroflexota bacterium]